MGKTGSVLFSLQSKLIICFVFVVLAALALAGSVFVIVRRGEQEQHQLDHVLASSPGIYARFFVLQERNAEEPMMEEFVSAVGDSFDARVLLVDRTQGAILADSDGNLAGETLILPENLEVASSGVGETYVKWEPEKGTPGEGLVFVSQVPTGQLRRFSPKTEPFWLFLAIPENSIANAWRELLPSLGIAAAFAIPVAILLAIIIARYITRPLQQLTLASQRMAEGDFDVRVSVDRSDEVGRLARTFSSMARRVGDTHSQMRALVANVSHDLKTPLTSILGFSQALRDGGARDDAEMRRMGGVIFAEATRLSTRLNDLLYLSELESGQAVLQRDDIDLRRLVESSLDRIEADTAARDVHVEPALVDGLVLSADGPKLERAVENLIDNARKYTPAGGTIHVRSASDDGYALVEVANTAADLSEEELPRLFERFYRHDRTRGSTGSGLGLPIARDLVELHGGTLDASLRNGELVFTARLPLENGQGAAKS